MWRWPVSLLSDLNELLLSPGRESILPAHGQAMALCSWDLQGKEAPTPSWSHFSLEFLGFREVCNLFQGRVPFFH